MQVKVGRNATGKVIFELSDPTMFQFSWMMSDVEAMRLREIILEALTAKPTPPPEPAPAPSEAGAMENK